MQYFNEMFMDLVMDTLWEPNPVPTKLTPVSTKWLRWRRLSKLQSDPTHVSMHLKWFIVTWRQRSRKAPSVAQTPCCSLLWLKLSSRTVVPVAPPHRYVSGTRKLLFAVGIATCARASRAGGHMTLNEMSRDSQTADRPTAVTTRRHSQYACHSSSHILSLPSLSHLSPISLSRTRPHAACDRRRASSHHKIRYPRATLWDVRMSVYKCQMPDKSGL